MSHKPGGRLPLLSARPAVTPRNPYEDCDQFRCFVNSGTMGVSSLPKTVTRQRRGCDLNPGPSAPESSTLTTRLPSHPVAASLVNKDEYTNLAHAYLLTAASRSRSRADYQRVIASAVRQGTSQIDQTPAAAAANC